MSTTSDFYLARAVQCARDAQDAILANVRDRNLRAEAAWRVMADRSENTEKVRLRQLSDKAAGSEAML